LDAPIRRAKPAAWRSHHGTSGAASRLRTSIHMEVLAALVVGERSPGLAPRDLEEIVDVESPDPDAVAPAGGGELHPVRTERHPLYGASGPSQAKLWCAGLGVEQPHQAVDARYRDARSVGAEGEVLDSSGRSGQYGHARTALHVPYFRDPIGTGQDDPRTVGIEVHPRPGSLRVHREEDVSPGPVPDPDALPASVVELGRRYQVAVRAERDVGEVEVFLPAQHSDHPPGAVDDLRDSLPVRRDQILAVRAEGDLVDGAVVSDPPELRAGGGI